MERHWKRLLGVMLLLSGCAPDPSGPTDAQEGTAQQEQAAEPEAFKCNHLQEVNCAKTNNACPPLPTSNQVCVITISKGANPVSPDNTCVRRRHLLKLRLAPGVYKAFLKFEGEGADALFENYQYDDIYLYKGEDSTWCGRVRPKAIWKGYPFIVSTETEDGKAGELEVVRDPGEEDE